MRSSSGQQGGGSPWPSQPAPAAPLAGSEENEFLWAGYSDLSEQLRKAHTHNQSLQQRVETLAASIQSLQQQLAQQHEQQQQRPSVPHGPWQAASFLLLFLVVINIAGMIASFHLAASSITWFGWGFKQQAAAGGMLLAKPMMMAITAAVPAANSCVVLVFCVQAVKAAWMCMRF